MDNDVDQIVANLDLEGITNNFNIWNHLVVRKQISSFSFLNVTYKPST